MGYHVVIGDISAATSAHFVVHSVTHNLVSDWAWMCPGSPGSGHFMFVGASTELAAADLRFAAFGLPVGAPTVVVVSGGWAPRVQVGPLTGLCVERPWRVHLPGGQVLSPDATGAVSFAFDPNAAPGPFGTAALQPGDVRYVQLWHRAAPTGGAFTPAVRIQVR